MSKTIFVLLEFWETAKNDLVNTVGYKIYSSTLFANLCGISCTLADLILCTLGKLPDVSKKKLRSWCLSSVRNFYIFDIPNIEPRLRSLNHFFIFEKLQLIDRWKFKILSVAGFKILVFFWTKRHGSQFKFDQIC